MACRAIASSGAGYGEEVRSSSKVERDRLPIPDPPFTCTVGFSHGRPVPTPALDELHARFAAGKDY